MEVNEQIKTLREFIEANYEPQLLETVRKGHNFMVLDFFELTKFNPELAEELLEHPEEILKAGELAVKEFDLPKKVTKFHLRFVNLPESAKILISEIRSKHLTKLLWMEGIVRQKSDVRPHVMAARFECPSCGNILTVLQLESKYREPSRCGCGRKGKFKELTKELIDGQGIVLEEAPEDLDGGVQPKRMNVFLKNDLVSPITDRKTSPGNKVRIVGWVTEVPINLRSGGKSTKFDLIIEANFIEPVQDDFSSLEISEEEIEKIKKLSQDPEIDRKLVESSAPSIFGHDKVKEALILQLVGGVRKKRKDGVITRGDMHVLLIGDPGAAKSQLLKRITKIAPKSRYVSGKGVSGAGLCVAPNSMIMTNDGAKYKIKQFVENELKNNERQYVKGVWCQKKKNEKNVCTLGKNSKIQSGEVEKFWRLEAPAHMIMIKTESDKKIVLTENTKLLLKKNRKYWKKSKFLNVGEKIACVKNYKKTKKPNLPISTICWEKIKEMKKIKSTYNYVYDLTVKNSHNFIVDGVLVHNTASVVKDEFLGGWSLEAGALVLANKGFVMIDEMDKMSREDRSAMHEALEQQCYHPDTEILFSDGSTQKIGEFVDSELERNSEKIIKNGGCEILDQNDSEILSTDFDKIFSTKLTKISRRPAPDQFVQIKFSNGRKLVVTPEHPIFVYQKNKIIEMKAEDVRNQQIVPAPNFFPQKNRKEQLSKLINSGLKKISIGEVKKLENKNTRWVYDITVEPHHNFISEGLVLHNSVSISKANIQATLRCETTVLAAANPKFGRFDPYGLVAEQINLPPALINRFDLIFPIKDLPDKTKDKLLAGHILRLHQNPEGKEVEIDTDLLKKYITYVRTRIKPILTDEAIEEIQQYYVQMRNSGQGDEAGIKSVPITARQLEALVRLAEASAKIRLSDKVLKQDAQKAIEMIDFCLGQIAKDSETGVIDIDRISSGIPAKERSKISMIREIIDTLENEMGKVIPLEAVTERAEEKGLKTGEVEEIIEKLRRNGDLYEPRRGFLSKL